MIEQGGGVVVCLPGARIEHVTAFTGGRRFL